MAVADITKTVYACKREAHTHQLLCVCTQVAKGLIYLR